MKSASLGFSKPRSKFEQELVSQYERIGISAVAGALACEDKAKDDTSARDERSVEARDRAQRLDRYLQAMA